MIGAELAHRAWEHLDGGSWTKPAVVGGPGVWSLDTNIRSFRNLDEAGMLKLPKMTYDRARARTIMIYSDALWEYDGASWSPRTLPATLTNCSAATMAAFDGHRNRTVVVGCGIPAQTWEWDGATWFGPIPTPFVGTGLRGAVIGSTTASDPTFNWMGPLQLRSRGVYDYYHQLALTKGYEQRLVGAIPIGNVVEAPIRVGHRRRRTPHPKGASFVISGTKWVASGCAHL